MIRITLTIFTGSLQYSPVYKTHSCAFGKECEKKGYSVKYLFSKAYEWMLPEEIKEKTIFIGNSTNKMSMFKAFLSPECRNKLKEAFNENHPCYVYLHNYNLLNHYVAHLCKQYGAKLIYHVHEPYVRNKKAHGKKNHYTLYLFEYMQSILLKKTDVAIVSSDMASQLFDERFPSFNGKKIKIPLMYEDLAETIIGEKIRHYITFVGPPVPAKGPQTFLAIVDSAAKKKLDLNFILISRLKITDSQYLNKRNLEIFHKNRISDEEFGRIIQESYVVLTPYKRETQSSVMLVSYMYGTPVASSKIGGLPEFVSHKKTGYLLDKDASIDEWIEGINYIKENFSYISLNCRKYFVDNFSGKNWQKYLNNILV